MMIFSIYQFIKRAFLFFVLVSFSLLTTAQRKMETLDRGLVAVKVQQGVFLSWRINGTEWYGTTYNVYRDGEKLNSTPLEVSNFSDDSGTINSIYTVTALINGSELEQCLPVYPFSKQYKEINLKQRDTSKYEINDATAADLDGDGQYEIIVKRIAKGWNENNTNYTYFEAYKMDGTLMWEINVGPNILPDVEINIAAFDFDEDGKAEVFMRTSEGTIFGDGTEIGDTDNDGRTNYRYTVGTTDNLQFMNAGPEFLSLIDGMTGAELDRVNFIPRGQSSDWGDNYGHRASKYFFGAPYLDGLKPSLFIGRGIYTKTIMRTYDIVNKKLQLRWEFNSGNSGPYFGQGNHNYTIADVDEDGRDEIVWGSMTVDDNGKGLYSTNMGHGDALHVGDLDPFRKGTEIFKCLENSPMWGTILYDGATGEILIHHYTTYDCGRCMAGNISDDIKGAAVWGGSKMFSASTKQEIGTGGGTENYRIFWDGDLLEEMTDHFDFTAAKGYGTGAIYKYKNGAASTVLLASGATSCNYTKGTPSLQADLFGDWREEVVWRNEANTAIRIYTTTDPTIYRNYTLMHDHQYRQAICWQMCGYNQPPHTSYFLGEGEGITVPPPPAITNNRLEYSGTGNWDKTGTNWILDGNPSGFSDGMHILFDALAGSNANVLLNETVSPSILTVNSPENISIDASNGKLSGEMQLVKQGLGAFTLNGKHDFSGITEVWNGRFIFNGDLENSPVWLGFFAEMNATGTLANGVSMRYASLLEIGVADSTGVLKIGKNLTLEDHAHIAFDLYSPTSNHNDSLRVNGDFISAGNTVFRIRPHLQQGEKKLAPGDYLLMTVSDSINADLSKISVDGITGTPCKLKVVNGNIYLEIKEVRSSSSIQWNGDQAGAEWDLALTQNFLNNNNADIFADQDEVTFNDAASSKTVNINTLVTPSSIVVDASTDYVFQGTGKITGNARLTKKGTGKLSIKNENDFTGKVLISAGIIEVAKMPASQEFGAIGAISSNPANLEINGGILSITAEGNSNRAVLMGDQGGTINNSAKILWYEPIAGGTLIKSGEGNLVLAGVNTHSKTILKAGTLTLQNDNTNPGKNISLEGGTLQCNDNSGSYSTIPWNIDVPEGKTATINLDSRAYYTGTLSGSGILNVFIPFVRSDFNGDMSAFTGILNFNSSYSNSSNNPAELRINHSKGLPNAHVNIESSVSTSNTTGTTFILGALSGKGNLDGAETYQIGAKGIDSEFKGLITAGSLTKTGKGEFTLSNTNTYTGGTIVNGGTLKVGNKSGSATGSGNVIVNNGAKLTGTGFIEGIVNIESGGILSPGNSNAGNKLNLNNNLNLKQGSTLAVKVNSLFDLADQVICTGKINIAGNLEITVVTSSFSLDDEFKLFDCASIEGTFSSITPEVPAENMLWNLTALNSEGIIRIIAKTEVQRFNIQGIHVYPNPVNDILTIEVEDFSIEPVQFYLTDITGKVRITAEISAGEKKKIDIGFLPAGLYTIRITQGSKMNNIKIVKQQ